MGTRTATIPEIPVRLVAALLAEAALITLSAGMLLTMRLARPPRLAPD